MNTVIKIPSVDISSTTTTTSTPEYQFLLTKYEQCVNKPSPYIRKRIADYLDLLWDDEIDYAIEQTAGAPRPSWSYCEAILKRLVRENQR